MASSGENMNTSVSSQASFSFSSSQFMFNDSLGNSNSNSNSGNQLQGIHRSRVRNGIEIPKSNSFQPSNTLAISPPSVSPLSYFAITPGFSPSVILDSPAFLTNSNIVPSPTAGTFAGQNFKEERNYSDFSFTLPRTRPSTSSSPSLFQSSSDPISEESFKRKHEGWNMNKPSEQSSQFPSLKLGNNSQFGFANHSFSSNISSSQTALQSGIVPSSSNPNFITQPLQPLREQKGSEDGYNWRKYGQKQVKGSENPRSYYKCTFQNCPTKKKVERTLEGQITEIVYKGSHNHPKPQPSKRSLSHSIQVSSGTHTEIPNQSSLLLGNTQPEYSGATPEYSSASFNENEFEQGSSMSKSDDENESTAKRWKGENENEAVSASGNRTVREPRIVVQTTSDIDILDDGYRWRKYGQKVVKSNPNPRSYYKCTFIGCPVRKHVERASQDLRAVITTYDGKHNHDVPAARGSGAYSRPISSNNNTTAAIRPVPISNNQNLASNYSVNYLNNTIARAQAPYTLEMVPDTRSFGYAGYENPSSYMNQTQRAKEEPKEDFFFNSFLN